MTATSDRWVIPLVKIIDVALWVAAPFRKAREPLIPETGGPFPQDLWCDQCGRTTAHEYDNWLGVWWVCVDCLTPRHADCADCGGARCDESCPSGHGEFVWQELADLDSEESDYP